MFRHSHQLWIRAIERHLIPIIDTCFQVIGKKRRNFQQDINIILHHFRKIYKITLKMFQSDDHVRLLTLTFI